MKCIIRNILACFSLSLLCSSCTMGLLYTDITLPYTQDIHDTTRGERLALSSRKLINEPFTGASLRSEWANYAIGKTAKNNNIKHIKYADIRHRSAILGIWQSTTIMVYGD